MKEMTTTERLKRMKKNHHRSSIWACLAIGFWIIETIVFQIIEGWHWKAVTPEEILMDDISNILFAAAMWFFVYAMIDLLNLFDESDVVTIEKTID